MTVYERIMEITYEGDFKDLKFIENRIALDLHKKGLSLDYSYSYNLPTDDMYGKQETESNNLTFPVTIADEDAFICEYRSDARKAVEQLCENGFDAEFSTINIVEKKKEWMAVRGRYFHCHFGEVIGEYTRIPRVSLAYTLDNESTVSMTTTFIREYGSWVLKFIIEYEAENITEKKMAKEAVIDVPLEDMVFIRTTVEETLSNYLDSGDLDFVVECNSTIKSESEYKCSQEAVDKVMKDD
tara:strand:- start:1219 stop:1941 length:723 start_codon:yes stop_codon:yes gene_type:complete